MTVQIDCSKCEAIYHENIDSHQNQIITANCPFCGKIDNIEIKEDED